jgi:hypothetical protein
MSEAGGPIRITQAFEMPQFRLSMIRHDPYPDPNANHANHPPSVQA